MTEIEKILLLSSKSDSVYLPKIKKLRCPKCRSHSLIWKNGPHGEFAGCNKFPYCKGSMSYSKVRSEIANIDKINLYRWKTQCWNCGQSITLLSYFPALDNTELSRMINFDNCCLGDMELIDDYLIKKHSGLKKMYSKGKKPFVVNVCSHCGEIQGNVKTIKNKMYPEINSLSNLKKRMRIVERIPVGKIMTAKDWDRNFPMIIIDKGIN